MQVQPSGGGPEFKPTAQASAQSGTGKLLDSVKNGAHQTVEFIRNSISEDTKARAHMTTVGIIVFGSVAALIPARSVYDAGHPGAGVIIQLAPIALGLSIGAAVYALGVASDVAKVGVSTTVTSLMKAVLGEKKEQR